MAPYPSPSPSISDSSFTSTMSSILFPRTLRKDEYRGDSLLVTEIAMLSVTIVIVVLRMLTRGIILGAMHSDDWWIMLATVGLISLTAVHGVGVKYGIGKHTDTLSKVDSDMALTMSYIANLLYAISLGFVKISLLLFLQRIFPATKFRRIVRGILIFVLCFTLTSVFLFAFQCDTPEYYFTKIKGNDTTEHGKCLAPEAVYYPMAAINIVTDIVIWCLPVPLVLRARMTAKEKLGLVWVFALGGVAVGASIVRPVNLRDIMEDGDPTWSIVNVSIWACIEISLGIICSSIPAIKPLILRVAPRILLSGSDGSRGDTHHPDGSRNHNLSTANDDVGIYGKDYQRKVNKHNANEHMQIQMAAYALRDIKITKDIKIEVEHESDSKKVAFASPGEFGMQAPVIDRTFEPSTYTMRDIVITEDVKVEVVEVVEQNPDSAPSSSGEGARAKNKGSFEQDFSDDRTIVGARSEERLVESRNGSIRKNGRKGSVKGSKESFSS